MRDDSGLIVIGCRQLKKMSLMQSTDAGHGPDWALMTPNHGGSDTAAAANRPAISCVLIAAITSIGGQ